MTESFAFLACLSASESARLKAMAEAFIATKHFEGVAGLEIDDRIRATIAAQACLLVLELEDGINYYKDWSEIIVYPTQFVPQREEMDEFGVVHLVNEPLAGEARLDGPVLISYDDVEAGAGHVCYHVIVHEFAHKLDMLNGDANGFPPLHGGMSSKAWSEAFSEAFARFCRMVEEDENTLIDPYASESPAEFFAVISEAFFDIPHELNADFPRVYEQLSLFYKQDPMQRMPPLHLEGEPTA